MCAITVLTSSIGLEPWESLARATAFVTTHSSRRFRHESLTTPCQRTLARDGSYRTGA